MKKIVIICLYCVFFTLFSAFPCFSQDWGDPFSNMYIFTNDDSNADSDFSFNDDFDTAVSMEEPAAPASEPAAVSESVSGYASEAAASAAAAKRYAEAAATSAAEAAASASAASATAASVTAASVTAANAVSPAAVPPQPPVRIIIPLPKNVALPPAAPPVQNLPPVKIIAAMPNPDSNTVHRVQVGAFGSATLARLCFSRLVSAGFSPDYEPYGNVNRIVLPGIKAADMAVVIQRLAAAGFKEVWIREEK